MRMGRGGRRRLHHVKMKNYYYDEKRRRKNKEKEEKKKSSFGFFTPTKADARFLYEEVIVKRTYLREGRVHLPECGATVIDVGANVGLFTCLCAAEQHARGAHVIAIEPNPSCCAAMELNLHRHDGALASLLPRRQQQQQQQQHNTNNSYCQNTTSCVIGRGLYIPFKALDY